MRVVYPPVSVAARPSNGVQPSRQHPAAAVARRGGGDGSCPRPQLLVGNGIHQYNCQAAAYPAGAGTSTVAARPLLRQSGIGPTVASTPLLAAAPRVASDGVAAAAESPKCTAVPAPNGFQISSKVHVAAAAAGAGTGVHAPACDPRSADGTEGAPGLPKLDVAKEIKHLLLLLNNPKILEQYAVSMFRRHDANRDGVLSYDELEKVIPQLHQELGLRVREVAEDFDRLVRSRMQRFDKAGAGVLSAADFVDLYRWTLWRKYEDVDPPSFKRGDFIGGVHKGNPVQFYFIGETLGSGQFGVTNEVTHRRTGLKRAMKTICKHQAGQSGTPVALLQAEIDCLALLDHPHVLRLFEYYNDTVNIYMVMDICLGGDLLHVVKEHAAASKPMPEAWVRRVFTQLLEAVAYCHEKGVIHKDLKLEHVMFQRKVTCASSLEDIHVVVIDVGLAELFGPRHGRGMRSKQTAGSLCTIAPEVLLRDFSYKCDIWSVGCMLYALYNPEPQYIPDGAGGQVLYTYPFVPVPQPGDPMGVQGLLEAQRAGPPLGPLEARGPALLEVLRQTLCYEEQRRPGAGDCLGLPWFTAAAAGAPALTLSRTQVQALDSDRESRLWWRAMNLRAATQLPASSLGQLAPAFHAIDRQRRGCIPKDRLASFLCDLGVPRTAAERVTEVADYDHSGTIEWSEFVAALLPASHELFAVSLLTAFQSLDTNCDGSLDSAEITELLRGGFIDTAHMPPQKTAETMIMELDTDHNGSISFTEFHDYFIHADEEDDTESP